MGYYDRYNNDYYDYRIDYDDGYDCDDFYCYSYDYNDSDVNIHASPELLMLNFRCHVSECVWNTVNSVCNLQGINVVLHWITINNCTL